MTPHREALKIFRSFSLAARLDLLPLSHSFCRRHSHIPYLRRNTLRDILVQNKATSTPRNQFIDFLKGFLIILVVYGHIIQYLGYTSASQWIDSGFWTNPVFKLIYMFHMPLFMAISGYLAAESICRKSTAEIIVRRFQQLIVPVICWTVLYDVFFLVPDGVRNGSIHLTAGSIISRISRDAWFNFWFLWAVFGATCVVAILRLFGQDRIIGFCAAFLLFLTLPEWGAFPMFKYTLPFFLIGYVVAGWKPSYAAIATPRNVLLLCLASIGCYFIWSSYTYIYTSGMHLSLHNLKTSSFRYAANITVSLFVLLACYRVFLHWKSRILEAFGRKSLDIYILSTFLIAACSSFRNPLADSAWFLYVLAPICALAICLLCMFIGGTIERNRVFGILLFGRVGQAEMRSSPQALEGGVRWKKETATADRPGSDDGPNIPLV
ncbi:MAG: acyltransferase family protein [Terrimicrobiaceae bacterium]|nr:acyltransferase family protein [Terrimicrobiaceae bacterium]